MSRLQSHSTLLAVLVSAGVVGAGCAARWDGGVGGALEDAAETAREGDDDVIVDLAEEAEFQWKRVYFFGPYPDRGEAEARLGFAWPGADDVSRRSREQGCVVEDEDGYARSESVFRVVTSRWLGEDGTLISMLVPGALSVSERPAVLEECGLVPAG